MNNNCIALDKPMISLLTSYILLWMETLLNLVVKSRDQVGIGPTQDNNKTVEYETTITRDT